jgi:hypothetical protein
VAVFRKLIAILQGRANKERAEDQDEGIANCIMVSDLHDVELEIFCWLHRSCFSDELDSLTQTEQSNPHVAVSSPIAALKPILQDGILSDGGRLSSPNFTLVSKHPISSQKNSPVMTLLIGKSRQL